MIPCCAGYWLPGEPSNQQQATNQHVEADDDHRYYYFTNIKNRAVMPANQTFVHNAYLMNY
jgi:hypothetical protein